MPMKYSVI